MTQQLLALSMLSTRKPPVANATTSDEMGDHYNNILNTLGQYINLLRELQISAVIAAKRGASDPHMRPSDALKLQKVS